MRSNNALLSLLCSLSLLLSLPRSSPRALLAARIMAVVTVVLSCLFLASDFGWIGTRINTLLAPDPYNPTPGRVSTEAAMTFIAIGLVLVNLRVSKRLLSKFIDLATLVLCLTMMTFLSRMVFGLSHIFTVTPRNPFAPQTFLLLSILTFLVTTRRAEYGLFSVLLSSGIGGKSARIAAPIAVILPFLFAFVKTSAVDFGLVTESSATAASTSLLSLIAFCLVLALSVRTDDLERAVRELSLRDELTKLYNRRGFYFLADQALRLAQRAGSPFFVLFIDLDDLKRTNDALGHEIGSELLREIAQLIEQTFRETDVVGRLGGDEFVVAGRADADSVAVAIRRLEEATAAANDARINPYTISYSLGHIFSEGDSETLDELLKRADMIMYESKRSKKRLRDEAILASV
jgi:diguanylate cyclase (GGDEF)-like protein